MYNGIGLTTARGSGTNGYVQRNLSFVRKSKEKIKEQSTVDAAVRTYDPELIAHERRRQIEVKCLELRELLEDEGTDEAEIESQVTIFRSKLMEESKNSLMKDSSGRPMIKDSHELALAQEDKNEKAKSAFGIRDDFIPGSSLQSKRPKEVEANSEAETVTPAKIKLNDEDTCKDTKATKKVKKDADESGKIPSDSSSSSSSSSSSDSESDSSSSSSSSTSSSSEASSSDSGKGRKVKKSRDIRQRAKENPASSRKDSTQKRPRSHSRSRSRSRERRRDQNKERHRRR